MKDILFINAIHTIDESQKNELRVQVNGTMILATKLLAADFNVDILRFYEIESLEKGDYYRFIEDITDRIISENPKCVSFYTLWPDYHVLLRIAQKIKERNPEIITVMGGPQSSATADATMKAMEFVDYIATGEGENTVVPFFTCILRENRNGIENIPGLYWRDSGEIRFNHIPIEFCDINTVPHWDERLYTVSETNIDRDNYFMPIDAGRGCPYSCTFCCTSLFWKRTYRLKSPERIVEDIKYYKEKYGIKSFALSHDAFTTNRKLVAEVCDHIIESELDIKWKCTARIDCISEELILKMQKAGLAHIDLGVETGSPRMQKLINKNLNLTKVREMIKFLIKNKIHVGLFFMYGFPEETEEDLNQTLELLFDVLDMGVGNASMSFCRFNPATDITNKYFDSLRLAPEINILARGIFGYQEEIEMLKSNKEIFSPFYHLDTRLRNEYQYLFCLANLYLKFPNSLKLIRRYYKGDNLKFFKDFYNNNIDVFKSDIANIMKNRRERPVEMLANTIKDFDEPLRKHLVALLTYDYDLQTVVKAKEDMSIQKKYDFDYLEYRMNVPVEKYSDRQSELLIEKKNGKVNVRIVSV